MTIYFYEFADGHTLYSVGKLSGAEKTMYRHQHGKILTEKKAK